MLRPWTYFQSIISPDEEEQVLQQDEDLELPPDVRRKPWLWDSANGYGAPSAVAAPPPGPASVRAQLYPEYPPWYYPPMDAYILDFPLNRIPVVIAAGASAVFALPTVPQGTRGVVRKLAGILTAGPALLADIRWTTRINLSPVQPFPGIRGAIGTLEAPQETQVILAAGDVFDVLVENTGLAAGTVAVRIYGWWWPDARI